MNSDQVLFHLAVWPCVILAAVVISFLVMLIIRQEK